MIDNHLDEDIVIKSPKVLIFHNASSRLHLKTYDNVISYLQEDLAHLTAWLDKMGFNYEGTTFSGISKSYRSGPSKSFMDLTTQRDSVVFKSLELCDSLIVFVLGIDGEGDMVCFDDDTLTLDDLIDPFKADKCEALKQKPKIFIIHVYDGIPKDLKKQTVSEEKFPTDADLFISFTKMDKDSHGPTVMSSFNDLVPTLEGKEINEVFSTINGEIINEKCHSLYSSTMTKFVYLLPPKS